MEQVSYLADGYWRQVGMPRVHSKYPLLAGGPLPILAVVGAYLYVIKIFGPRYMANRKQPFNIDWIMRPYNITLSLINGYLFYKATLITHYGLAYLGCKKVGSVPGESDVLDLGYIFFITKLVELLDTVFFVLRKKWSQCSKMHVFHHSAIICILWLYFKLAPGGSGSFLFPYLNAGIHAIMYGYYFLATFPSVQPYLGWKRLLTVLQIVQFIICAAHFSHQLLESRCDYPKELAVLGLAGCFLFITLFCNFYYHAYLKKRKI